jgi:hypothetical protein
MTEEPELGIRRDASGTHALGQGGLRDPRRGIHYDFGEGHPLLGRRMPDLDLVTADGPLRVFTTQQGLADALTTWFGPPGAA